MGSSKIELVVMHIGEVWGQNTPIYLIQPRKS